MTEVNIPDEARQHALSGPLCESVTWRQLDEILGLAAPLIVAAELERIAAVSHETAQSFTEANMVIRRDDYLTFARVLKDRASELRGEG